jgi:NADH-quinone oxidoreductase subunit C
VCLKVVADHNEPSVPSVYSVWQGADLQEREVYDLMGIRFPGHPNLKRVLLWDEFEGHPLRKDFGLANQDAWRQMPPMPQVET